MDIDLVEIGIGNIGSVKRCLQRLGVSWHSVGAMSFPDGQRPIILPGVGKFGAIMQTLKKNNFDQHLRQLLLKGTP
jgi:imidazoleglycerol phosphate synthase glutamine amidotransferase subunit HisH